MKLKAKKLILDLMVAARGKPVSARDIVAACRLFGISENNARVSLARLGGEGLIKSAGRGQYLLSSEASALGEEVGAWRQAEKRLRPWSGQYVVVHTGALGRSDRSALRRRERALEIMGFRPLESGLFLRPDNIERDLAAIRRRLYSLGLESEARVFLGDGFSDESVRAIGRLWDGKALNRAYREQIRTLDEWRARHGELEPEVAAREAFLLGGNAIRQIVFDPLLPDSYVDAGLRHRFFRAMIAFDKAGQRIWRNLHDSLAGMPNPPPG